MRLPGIVFMCGFLLSIVCVSVTGGTGTGSTHRYNDNRRYECGTVTNFYSEPHARSDGKVAPREVH